MHPHLNVFGSPQLLAPVGRLDLPATAPGWLLAVLAVAGGAMARDALMVLMWPDAGSADAQRQLRVTLHRSRQWLAGAGLADALQGDRSRVRLQLASDVADFRAAAARADWPAAVALQPAPLLTGPAVRGLAALDDWVARQRDILRAQWRTAARSQADQLERQGQPLQTWDLLSRLLHDDLLAEDSLQALLRVAASAGQQAAALAAFERFRGRAADELGLAPLPQTLQLADALRRPRPAAPPPSPAAPPAASAAWPPALREPPLLARAAPLAELARRVAALTVVQGEPGAGKTRLVAAALAAPDEGQTALWIEGRDVLQPAPLQALAAALAPRLNAVRALGLSAAQRLALARLLPDLVDGPPPLADPQSPSLHAALVALLGRWPGPLVIDDLQWLDPDSVAVLGEALALMPAGSPDPAPDDTPVRAPLAPGRWLATLRPAELGAAGAAWLTLLEAQGQLQRLVLSPLPQEAVAAMASLALGRPSPPLAQWLAARTGGNPLFLLESLRALADDGRLQPGSDPALQALMDAPVPAVPPRLAGLVRQRLARQGDATVRVLRVAALIGDAEAMPALAELSGLSPWAVAQALADAQQAGLLSGRRFAHDLVRQVLVDELPEPVRTLLHAGIARVLASRLPPHLVAEHWWAAGEPAQALEAALTAAWLDGERGLLDAAERLLAATADRLGERPAPALDAARIPVARAYLARQRLDLDAAERWAIQALAALPMPATRQAALVERFEIALWRGQLQEAADWLAQAQDINPDLPSLWLDGAKLAHARGDADTCAALTARHVQWLRRQPPGADLAGALTSQGVALDVAGRHADALPLHEEALAIARRINARTAELEAAGNLVFCLGEMGRDADAARVGLQAQARGDGLFNAPLTANTAYSLLALGRLDEAEQGYRRVHQGENASAACAAAGKLLEIAARRSADGASLALAVDAVFAAVARTEVYGVQAGALVAVLNHGQPGDLARVRRWLRDEPLYPGLQQRLDEALARHEAQAALIRAGAASSG